MSKKRQITDRQDEDPQDELVEYGQIMMRGPAQILGVVSKKRGEIEYNPDEEVLIQREPEQQEEEEKQAIRMQPRRSKRISKMEQNEELAMRGTLFTLDKTIKINKQDPQPMRIREVLTMNNIELKPSSLKVILDQSGQLQRNWFHDFDINPNDWYEGQIINPQKGVTEEEHRLLGQYLTVNAVDFISIPLMIEGAARYLGTGHGERITMFSPIITLLNQRQDQEYQVNIIRDYRLEVESVTLVNEMTYNIMTQSNRLGGAIHFAVIRPGQNQIICYENGVNMNQNIPTPGLLRGGTEEFFELKRMNARCIVGPNTKPEDIQDIITNAKFMRKWYKDNIVTLEEICSRFMGDIICRDSISDILVQITGAIQYNEIPVTNQGQIEALSILSDLRKFHTYFNRAHPDDNTEQGLIHKQMISNMLQLMPVKFGNLSDIEIGGVPQDQRLGNQWMMMLSSAMVVDQYLQWGRAGHWSDVGTMWMVERMNWNPVIWITMYYVGVRRIIQFYAALFQVASKRIERFSMLNYAMLIYIEENFFLQSSPVMSLPKDMDNPLKLNLRRIYNMPDLKSSTMMKIRYQARSIRIITSMFYNYIYLTPHKSVVEANALKLLTRNVNNIQGSVYNMIGEEVQDIEKFTEVGKEQKNREQFTGKFPTQNFDNILAHIRVNKEIFGINYQNQAMGSTQSFSGVKIYRGMITGDHLSTMASSLSLADIEEITEDVDIAFKQRGVVFLVLFAILMEQITDYENLVRQLDYIPSEYLIIMQILMSSTLTNINRANNPDAILTEEYAMKKFRFRTLALRFEVRMNEETGRFNILQAIAHFDKNPSVHGQMEISTTDFRNNPAPFYREFVLRLQQIITETILGHTENSDVNDYNYGAQQQPEYTDPRLLAQVTQFTTFFLPKDTNLDVRDMFRRTGAKDFQLYNIGDSSVQNEHILATSQMDQFLISSIVAHDIMKEDHPAHKNCVVLLFAYVVLRKMNNELINEEGMLEFLRSDTPNYNLDGPLKTASLIWLIDNIQVVDNTKYQVFFIVDYCQVWIHIPEKLQHTKPTPHTILQDVKLQIQTLYYAAVNIAQQHIQITTAQKIIDFIHKASRHEARKNWHGQTLAMRTYTMRRPDDQVQIYVNNTSRAIPIDPKNPIQFADNIITLDFETTNIVAPSIDQRYPMIPYCCVIVGKVMGQEVKFHVMGSADTVKREVLQFFNHLLINQQYQKQITCFAHNGSQFDYVILLPWLLDLTPDVQIYGNKTDIQQMTLSGGKILFLDFRLLMSGRLKQIAISLQASHQKMECEQIKQVDSYDSLSEQQIQKILEYCFMDCYTLLDCIILFYTPIKKFIMERRPGHKFLQSNVFLAGTAASMAESIFRHCFLPEQKQLYGCANQEISLIQSDAYYGGMVQVFNHKVLEDVRYVDVNSLYPAAMRRIHISRQPAQFYKKFAPVQYSSSDLIDAWSLYYVEFFQFQDDAYGLLPVRTDQQGLLYPKQSQLHSWRTGTELKALLEYQFLKTLIISGKMSYDNVQSDVFTDYVDTFYQRKSSPGISAGQKAFYKLMLNSLYGKMGQRNFQNRILIQKSLIESHNYVTMKAYHSINASLMAYLVDDNHKSLFMYSDLKLAQDLIEAMNAQNPSEEQKNMKQQLREKYVPRIKAINDISETHYEVIYQQDGSLDTIGSLKRIALFTTGEARAIMIRAMGHLYKQNLLHEVYYMDTDSFFMSREAYKFMKAWGFIHNSNLGMFKNQMKKGNKILKAQFIAPKAYYYYYFDKDAEKNPVFHGKFKGLRSDLTCKNDIFYQALWDDQPYIQQEQWMRRYGMVFILDTVKKIMIGSRRYVFPDGSTRCFTDVQQFMQYQDQRLQYNQQSIDGKHDFIYAEQLKY